jgi:magnesium chelatase family protein
MLARVRSGAVQGVDGVPIWVEVDVRPGIPSFSVVGLAQSAVREGRDRVRAALENSGFERSAYRVTVNLAPADVKKEGSGFDLPIALGLLAGAGHIQGDWLEGRAFVGELGLDGELRTVRGVLAIARQCARDGTRSLIVPEANAREAAAADPHLQVVGARSLRHVVDVVSGQVSPEPTPTSSGPGRDPGALPESDLADVRGHDEVKRALEVAAAGGHNVLMIGPPGSGKTMLARRLPGILPPMERDEALDVTTVHSVAGLLAGGDGLVRQRPFRAPHHTVSAAGMSGGGHPLRPGEMSLAHHGILFLDELPEFSRRVLETLRQPLESGWVQLVRARERVRFPARFNLVAAMNPCPCGKLGDPIRPCGCDATHVSRYRGRISGPLKDRIDLHLEVTPVPFEELDRQRPGEGSAMVRSRVVRARQIQSRRFADRPGVRVNGQMGPRELDRHARPGPRARKLLAAAVDQLGLSSRAAHRILKVGRTIADLDGAEVVARDHVSEAIHYRILDRGSAPVS